MTHYPIDDVRRDIGVRGFYLHEQCANFLFSLYPNVSIVEVTEYMNEWGIVHVTVYGECDTPAGLEDLFWEYQVAAMKFVFHCVDQVS